MNESQIAKALTPKKPVILPFDASKIAVRQPWLTVNELQTWTDVPMPGLFHYIYTREGEIVEEPHTLRWVAFHERASHRIIAESVVTHGTQRLRAAQRSEMAVATVFHGASRDSLFETTITGGWLDGRCRRSETKFDAVLAHGDFLSDALDLDAYLRKNGRRVKKLDVRSRRMCELARKRGYEWSIKHLQTILRLRKEALAIPGTPHFEILGLTAAVQLVAGAARSSQLRLVG